MLVKAVLLSFQTLYTGWGTDAAAICEAITSKWSNRAFEGHVNHLYRCMAGPVSSY